MVTWNLAWIIIIPLCVALGHARFHMIIICFLMVTWNLACIITIPLCVALGHARFHVLFLCRRFK